ncbi:MAG: Iron-sulfur cluster insertion protein ErpA [Chlamydiae bacterium]|nr:Iron-sulfur cluster insertion protein ErpA [Chlamydiota bacterium]
MTEEVKKISREMTIENIFAKFPQKAQKLAQELTNTGLHCVGCQAAAWETLEAGMLGHGYSEVQIDKLVRNLNGILEEKMDLKSINLTKRAAEKFKQILKEEGKEEWGLSFGDKAAGCSGFEYVLDFSKEAKEDDQTFVSNGVNIFVNKGAVGRLIGCEIDYVDGLNNAGFKITNPNAKSSCGCGKSQSY